ncbi:MAG: ABC transporter permease [Planctomycetota bacterium]
MIGWILLAILGALVIGVGELGLVWRWKRLGAKRAFVTPLTRPVLGILIGGGFFAAIFWLSGFVIAFTFVAVLIGVAILLLFPALGWDEFLDRVAPGFQACLRRELYRQFSTPIPWFVLFLFAMLSGVFFEGNLAAGRQITLRYVWETIITVGTFLFPLLTMGLFAQERSEGTIEVLMTAPVSSWSVTTAKFFSTVAFYLVMLAPTLIYYAILLDLGQEIGKPDTGPAITSYLGLVLLGAFYISLGLFCSALTSSQILAALLTWVFVIFFFIAGQLPVVIGEGVADLSSVLEYIQPQQVHLMPFLKGVIDPKNIVFYLSFIVFFLFLGTRAIESRKGR